MERKGHSLETLVVMRWRFTGNDCVDN